MDILSFTTIILILFITIGAYLIFTNQIEGRAKIIIIVAVFICFIYIFMNLNLFKSYTETKSSPVNASTIQSKEKVDTTSTSFSLSTWIYITDWNSGTAKTLFSMTNDITNNPTITIGPYNNELVIQYFTVPSTAQRDDWSSTTQLPLLYQNYVTAKENWIKASNNERHSNGFYKSTQTSGEVADSATAAIAPDAFFTTATSAALTALTTARTNYDGGSVGTSASSNTILTASVKTITTPAVGVVGEAGYTPAVTTRTSASVTDTLTSSGTGITTNPASGLYKYLNTPENNQGTWTQASLSVTGTASESRETIIIKEISIQKWVNIVVSFGDNTVDTYINGKLVDSHVSTGSVQKVTTTASNSTLNWGGFTGYISASRYYPMFLTPQEAWNIYKGGFSDNLMGNFLNQYNAKFTFTQNQVEKASFNII
jgi:hypothetical protein